MGGSEKAGRRQQASAPEDTSLLNLFRLRLHWMAEFIFNMRLEKVKYFLPQEEMTSIHVKNRAHLK
jgi:hypothetical protein